MKEVDAISSSGAGGNPSMERARELFFQYDGSRFYMSRDGVESEYLDYAVPRELELQWRQQLTAEKIAKLDQPGNWWTLNYLCHHNDTRFLHEVVRAEPLGELWKRVSYVELLLEYTERCSACYPRDDIRAALQTVLARTAELDIDNAPEDEREEQLRGRVRKLSETANLILARQSRIYLPRPPGCLTKTFMAFRRRNDAAATKSTYDRK
jgi:hypothetical protein